MKKKDDFKMLLMNLFDLIYTEIDNDKAKEYGLDLVKKLVKNCDNKILLKFKEIYPITIIRDRYGGTYSGGKFLAFNLDFDEIPEDVNEGDIDCSRFWLENKDMVVGRGETLQKAYDDLYIKIFDNKEYSYYENNTRKE